MKLTKLLLFGFALFAISSCSNSKTDISELILGEWYNESMIVTIDHGKPEESAFKVPIGSWEEVLGIKPILTTYTEDGNYTSVYTDLSGEVSMETSGTWEVKGDSLYLTENDITTAYKFVWMDGKGEFTGFLDWDSDGLPDDLYSGIQIKK
ncbi:hypothetical protein [Roseivirga seohaensis]|uniref:hypothetical protein n=1 Tax=Roseivirga seohaensis TaxID=1914963 RepID=UPI003BAC57FF